MLIKWEIKTEKKFQELLNKIPVFMRPIAQDKITKKAENLTLSDGRIEVTEKDMVDAFFLETPFGFHGPMKSDMLEAGIDFQNYGHPK